MWLICLWFINWLLRSICVSICLFFPYSVNKLILNSVSITITRKCNIWRGSVLIHPVILLLFCDSSWLSILLIYYFCMAFCVSRLNMTWICILVFRFSNVLCHSAFLFFILSCLWRGSVLIHLVFVLLCHGK